MSGLPSWARVGAKVICIDASGRAANQLNAGEVYVINWAGLSDYLRQPMIGIAGTTDMDGNEGQWRVTRFRPLITLRDDLEAHFQHLLHTPSDVPGEDALVSHAQRYEAAK